MIGLEVPRRLRPLVAQAHQVAESVLRPVARRYDRAEHTYPRELDLVAAMIDGVQASGATSGAGATGVRRTGGDGTGASRSAHLASVLSVMEMCWGDVGLLLSMPRQGLGNSAIASVGTPEQVERFARVWAAMAITEPGCGSDSAAIRTTARREGDEYVLDGEKIYVTAGERCDAVVVWATLDRALGRAGIRAFVVPKGTPGLTVERLESKLGIRASDTAALRLAGCRVPADHLLGSPGAAAGTGFASAMATFDNTRPLVAAMAVGCARAALEVTASLLAEAGVRVDHDRPPMTQHAAAAAYLALEADWEAAYLLTLRAAWLADRRRPNSLEASMAKAKAGRTATDVTLRCVELAGSLGYGEHELLEKWSRDAKILDIFEGTQQIQQLVIARRLLGKTSAELA